LTSSVFGAASGLISACLLSACSNAAVSKAVGTTDGKSAIIVGRSGSAVSVENRVGRPLLNIRVTVETVETGTPFVLVLPTMDNGEHRDLRFEELRNEDGALLDPVSVHPKQVKVTARDTLANPYNVTIPWDQ
jgi:hypothetical protein